MAQAVAALADVDAGRRDGAALLGGEGAAIDVDAGRQRRPDLGQRAGDGEEGLLVLADAVAGEAAQQADGVGVLGVVEDLAGRPLLDDLPGVHHADPVAHRADHAEVVGDEQDGGRGLVAQGLDQVEHLRLHRGVEAGRRLVQHQELRVAGQGHGDHHALLHAARQLVRVAAHHRRRVGDAHPPERVGGQPLGLGRLVPEQREALDDLRSDAQRRVQGSAGILVHHRRVAGAERAQLRVVHQRDVVTGHLHVAGGDAAVGREVAQRGEGGGRLAAAGLPHQAVGLAWGDAEGDAPQDGARDAPHVVRDLEVGHLEGGGRRRRDGVGHASDTAWMESAIRFTAITSEAMASAGNNVGHHCPDGM